MHRGLAPGSGTEVWHRGLAPACAAAIGAGFFVWIAGLRLVDPREVGWLMRLDWQIHYLGWHLFRHEAWHLPPGLIVSEFYPVGTSIAYTDSVPLAAFLLKPWSRLLPDDFQYLGLWLVICYALQGAFAALLVGCWTDRVASRLAGASLIVLSPVLLDRVGHVALCAHWLLLASFWLYVRQWPERTTSRIRWWSVLVLAAAFVQPYLWAMVVVLSAAAALRYAIVDRQYTVRDLAVHMAATVLLSAAAAWTLGWLMLSSSTDRSGGGLGYYSMNLLGPLASNGWAALGPALSVLEGQTYEGFNYLGAGVFALIVAAAAALVARRPTRRTVLAFAPLLLACGLMAVAALSPTITFGRHVVAEVPLPDRLLTWYATFRSTGRFFWPAGYLLAAGSAGVVVARYRPLMAVLVLTMATALQAYDLRSRYFANRATRSDPAWYQWTDPSRDSFWSQVAPRHRHFEVVPSGGCGTEITSFAQPASFAPLLLLAGRYGLTANVGNAARLESDALTAACQQVMAQVQAGQLQSDTIYVVRDADWLRATTRIPLTCRPLAGATGCVVNDEATAR